MDLAGLPDEALVEEYRRSAPTARAAIVNELFGRHYTRVARWCFRFTNDRHSAADLAQEVFLKAHRHLDAFKGTSRFTTWLYVIVRNESLTWLKRLGPPVEDDDVLAELASTGPTPEDLAHESDRAAHVRALLATTLDETERRVFTLHYGEDVPLDAITRLLRLTNASGAKAYVVSARRKLARAVQRLRARGDAL
jgi:RNA polymerase sigma-70 factor (ECF subfamily)